MVIKANFDTIKTNFEANLRETDQALKEEMESLKTDIKTGIKVRINVLSLTKYYLFLPECISREIQQLR